MGVRPKNWFFINRGREERDSSCCWSLLRKESRRTARPHTHCREARGKRITDPKASLYTTLVPRVYAYSEEMGGMEDSLKQFISEESPVTLRSATHAQSIESCKAKLRGIGDLRNS